MAPVLIFLIIAVVGSSRIASGYHFKAYCHGSREVPEVSLSFDDGPDPTVTPQVLDLLRKKGVRASFFLIGERADAHPGLVERIHREGHLLGNHSWGHSFFFDLYSTERMWRGIEACAERIASITGRYPLAFRPPYGVSNPMLKRAIERSGSIPVGWDLRSFDTRLEADACSRRVLRKLRPGSLILFHDTDEKLVRILPEVLEGIERKGFRVVPLEQLLQKGLSYETDASTA